MISIGREGRDCKRFSGYRPCSAGEDCSEQCLHPEPQGIRILIVNLDAMGDVLMTTAQLAGIKRAWPDSTVFWLTLSNAAPLLRDNPYLDAVYAWNDENRMILAAQHFDVVLNADKSISACAFVTSLDCDDLRGFILSNRGQIIPANPSAEYNYKLGLDDHLKFKVNKRTGQDILAETWDIDHMRDEYVLVLDDAELEFCSAMRKSWRLEDRFVVAFNTGCSELYPNKKMTVDQHVRLIDILAGREDLALALLGGREDRERNAEIADRARASGIGVISTPTDEGLRRGICYENLAHVVVTGDSFGMHLAIALKKHVLAWFGLSCWTEIDLYDRGRKFYNEHLQCSPCWKRECPHNLECIESIDLDAIAAEIFGLADKFKRQRTL